MQGIEFEEDKNFQGLKVSTLATSASKQSFLMGLLEKIGIADKAIANFILLGIAMVFFGIMIFLYAGVLGENVPSKQTATQIVEQMRLMREMEATN